MSETFAYVGKRLPFIGAEEKVTGRTKYSVDIKVPGAYMGKLLTSPHAHARIKSVDISAAEKLPGVGAVITFRDIPKLKINPSIQKWMHHHPAFDLEDMYIVSDKARYIGDLIGAVAAVNEKVADEALQLIKVDYEVLPAVFDPIKAMEPDAPWVHEEFESNVSQVCEFAGNHGDADAFLKTSDVFVEARVRTSRQHLMPLEPLNCTARFEADGGLTCWTTNQRPMTIRKQIAELFELPEASVNIICKNAGGFFGESNWPIVPVCIALAKKARKVVHMEYPRELYVLQTATREVFAMWGKLGFKSDGTLLAGIQEVNVESGAYFNRSNATANPTMGAFSGNYRMPAYKGTMRAVYTNTTVTGGSRGYGGPQAVLLLEHLMDLAAEKLGLDPLEMRIKNFKKLGDRAIQAPFETLTQEKVLRLAAEKFGWYNKLARTKEDGVFRRGVGMANYMDVSGGQPFEIMDRHCVMNLEEDGSVTVTQCHPDGGMNLMGACTAIAAEVSGLRFEDFRHIHGQTKGALFDMGLAANSGLYGMGNLYAKAAAALKAEILQAAAEHFKQPPENLEIKNAEIFVKTDESRRITVREFADRSVYNHHGPSEQISVKASFNPVLNPAAVGAVMADIKVDMETGEIKVQKLLTVHDCGRAINPMGVEGQLQGGMLIGYGYAMFEDLAIDKNGVVQANNFNRYKLPSTLDYPEMEIIIYEEPAPSGPFGGKAVGMSGTIGIASSIANALYHATGIWLEEMPFTPERVLAAIKGKH